MKRAAVFFDRDNTLIANDGFLGDPSKVALVTGAAEAVARVRGMGFAAVTFSNQSGVARGMFTEETVHAVNSRLDEMLQDHDPHAVIDRHEFCPYHPAAIVERYRQDSPLRKPKPGMILQAAERLELDLSRSWVIGDAPRDVEAGKAVGCRAILFSDPGLKPSPAAGESSKATADFIVNSLKEAVDIIERNTMSNTQTDPTSAPHAGADRSKSTPVPAKAPAAEAAGGAGAPRRMTFAERIRAGTFQPARTEPGSGPPAERPKRTASTTPSADRPVADAAPEVRPTEPVSDVEQLEPLLQQILEEVRLMRQRQPYAEFALSKLLAGITQVLVFPALFFAYLHRDVAADLQSMLMLATVLQAMTIALLIMGRQS